MLRNALLYLSDQQHIFKFVRNNRLAKSFANRFVAGETLDTALSAVVRLNARGITASLDLLPEVVVHNGDGPGRHIVYFARQGSGFPPMNASEATAQ